MACLRLGVLDRPDMPLRPFRLSTIRFNAEESLLMEEVIAEKLAGRIWEELTPEQPGVPSTFRKSLWRWTRMVRGGQSGTSLTCRPLLCGADKVGDARGLLRLDEEARHDVNNGPPLWIQLFPAAPFYERLLCRLSEADGWYGEVFPVPCPAIRLVPQRLLVLATGLLFLDDHQVSFWLPGPELCRRLSNISFHREGFDKDGLSTSLSPLGQAVVALCANSPSDGWWVSSAPASGICFRLGAGFDKKLVCRIRKDRMQIVVPETMVEKVIQWVHGSRVVGHWGVTRTALALASRYWWLIGWLM
jgi:Integrase zinc binding domain